MRGISQREAPGRALQRPTILGFGTSNYHLSGSKDQCSGLGLTDAHDDGGETLWIVLRISRMKSNSLQVETAIEVDRSNNVSSIMPLSLKINKRHNKVYTHCKVGTAMKSVFGAPHDLRLEKVT